MRNITILLLLSLSFGTVTDIDGNVYETVQIGDQLWMAENLKVTHYNNGEEIPHIVADLEWYEVDAQGAYCYFNNNPNNLETFGNMYNWYVVDDDRGVCPYGWHVPSEMEYYVLRDYLGGVNVAGGKMKSTGTLEGGDGLWYEPNLGATNESGFTGLPGGYRIDNGYFGNLYEHGGFWSTSETNDAYSTWFILKSPSSTVTPQNHVKEMGFSVRCIEDGSTGCTDPEACNYDESATVDDGSCAYEYDCAGTCGGDLEPDCCGVCGGDNSQCSNCCGSPFNDDCSDDCFIDVSGVCCYELEVNSCGTCGEGCCNRDNWEDYYPNMQGCDLEGADLNNENLTNADLTNANLVGTWFFMSDLEGAVLVSADANFAMFPGANLTNTNLSNAELGFTNFVGANLTNANLSDVELQQTNLNESNLNSANLTNANCMGTSFINATLEGTNFEGANLTYTYFDEDGDTHDDVSYEVGATSGDFNFDGEKNILDVVGLVHSILNP